MLYKVLECLYNADDKTAPPTYTSTNAKGPFKRDYTPGVGCGEFGAGLFLYTTIADAQDCALGTHRVIWEVEPLSEVYTFAGQENDMLASVFLSDLEAEGAEPAWKTWYEAVKHDDLDMLYTRVERHKWAVSYTNSHEGIVLCDSFRYVREIPLDDETTDEGDDDDS